jgi:hypothetical protein
LNDQSERKLYDFIRSFRTMYLTVLVFSTAFCIRTIKDAYNKTDKNPILFKIDEKMWRSKEVSEKLYNFWTESI